jgi:hypothetical protein
MDLTLTCTISVYGDFPGSIVHFDCEPREIPLTPELADKLVAALRGALDHLLLPPSGYTLALE